MRLNVGSFAVAGLLLTVGCGDDAVGVEPDGTGSTGARTTTGAAPSATSAQPPDPDGTTSGPGTTTDGSGPGDSTGDPDAVDTTGVPDTDTDTDDGSESTGDECQPLVCHALICGTQFDACLDANVDCGACTWTEIEVDDDGAVAVAITVDDAVEPRAAWIRAVGLDEYTLVYGEWRSSVLLTEDVADVLGLEGGVDFDDGPAVDVEVASDGTVYIAYVEADDLRVAVNDGAGWSIEETTAGGRPDIQLVLAEDQPFVRTGFGSILSATAGWGVALPSLGLWSSIATGPDGLLRALGDEAGQWTYFTESDGGWTMESIGLGTIATGASSAIAFDGDDRLHLFIEQYLDEWYVVRDDSGMLVVGPTGVSNSTRADLVADGAGDIHTLVDTSSGVMHGTIDGGIDGLAWEDAPNMSGDAAEGTVSFAAASGRLFALDASGSSVDLHVRPTP